MIKEHDSNQFSYSFGRDYEDIKIKRNIKYDKNEILKSEVPETIITRDCLEITSN